MQQVLDVSNDVAAELATIGDGVLDALRDRLRCTIRLRGNRLTIEGDDDRVTEARAVVDELVELVEGGHEIGPSTVDAVPSVSSWAPRTSSFRRCDMSVQLTDPFVREDTATFQPSRTSKRAPAARAWRSIGERATASVAVAVRNAKLIRGAPHPRGRRTATS